MLPTFSQVRGYASGRVSQREERDPHGPDVGGRKRNLWASMWGSAAILCRCWVETRGPAVYQDQKVEEKRLEQLNGSRENHRLRRHGVDRRATWGESEHTQHHVIRELLEICGVSFG